MEISESAENYLETILILKKRIGNVRSVDIANELDYSKPSISHAMKLLRESGYVKFDENGFVRFTNKGRKAAERIYNRHRLLTELLLSFGVDETTAKQDACKIEHVISEQTYERVKAFFDKKSPDKYD